MSDLYDLKPFIIPYVQGCPEPVLEQAIRMCGDDFCRKTRAWQENIVFDMVESEDSYNLVPLVPTGTFLLAVISVEINESPTIRYELKQDDILTFPSPHTRDLVDGIDVVVSLGIQLNHHEVPDWMYQRYSDVFRNGILYHLKSMNKKPWTDKEDAEMYWHRYCEGKRNAMNDLIGIRSNKMPRAQMRPL